MKDRLRVMFVSRRNSMRSVLAEGCLAHWRRNNSLRCPDLPRWPGQLEFATWPFPDIAAAPDREETAIAAIRMLYALRRRLELLVSLPLHSADRNAIRSDVRDLAHLR